MAKANINIPLPASFSGSIGNFSIVTNQYGTTFLRAKGGGTKEQIATLPSFEPTRNQNVEFGGASKGASMLGNAMESVKHLNNINVQGYCTGLINILFELDPGIPGSRPIIFSRAKHLIEGMQLHSKHSFDSVVTTPISFTIDRNEHQAILQLPSIVPGRNLINPWPQYPLFRVRMNLGIIRDMEYVEGFGYKPVLEDITGYTESLNTEWYQVNSMVPGQEVGLKILDPVFDESCHLLLSIGIEFATLAYGRVKPVKKAGCAKVLGMG